VHDDIIRHIFRQENKLIIEVYIPFLGTTSPAGFLITNRDRIYPESVVLIEKRGSFTQKLESSFFIVFVILAVHFAKRKSHGVNRVHFELFLLYFYPFFFTTDKLLDQKVRYEPGCGNYNSPVGVYGYADR
jgi:hypothetical protein